MYFCVFHSFTNNRTMILYSRFAVAFLCSILLAFAIPCHAQLSYPYDTKLGIDVLEENQFAPLIGKRVALVANHTARSRDLRETARILSDHPNIDLIRILSPEHGYFTLGRAGEHIDSVQTLYGAELYSLYGKYRKPTAFMLDSVDVVVFDVQDIGVRAYTYISTLVKVMEACAEFDKPLIVLDRPNPIGGNVVDGAVLDTAWDSFVGIGPIPYVHGMTIGEIAMMANQDQWLGGTFDSTALTCDVSVVAMKQWERWMRWEDTGFAWVPPSPHVPTVDAARGAAVTGIYGELSLVSIGIGYTQPFQLLGSPEFDTDFFLEVLRKQQFPGIELIPVSFRPFYGKFKNEDCRGLLLGFHQSHEFQPYTAGVELALTLRRVQPALFDSTRLAERNILMFRKVTGSEDYFTALFSESSDEEVRAIANRGVRQFLERRRPFLLYE